MTNYTTMPLDFPDVHPDGFPQLKTEPVFDAKKHLQIEMPNETLSLKDLGYSDEDIALCPCEFGVTSTFRILSDEGAECLLDVARQLEEYTTSHARISRNVRGGIYQSKFLRDLCMAPELTEAVSKICGIPLLPHTMPHQLGHLNYNPLKVGENVDKWHVDTLRIDFVLFVTDPNLVDGGEFEFYKGTKHEVAELKKLGKDLDPAKVTPAAMPGPGYGVLQQGNMVVHRAKGLRKAGERITMVNGYVPQDITHPDFTRFDQLFHIDPKHVCASEYSRHVTWMAKEALAGSLHDFVFTENLEVLAKNLENVSQMLKDAATQLRSVDEEDTSLEHFGDK